MTARRRQRRGTRTRRPSLSVCCLTGDPGAVVAGVLKPLCRVADEVVVAADSRASAQDLAAYASVADRLFRFTYSYSERHLEWLHAQCSGDWILRIDGDEVVSPELLDQLPDLIRTRSVLQYWFVRRWLFPDPSHWLDEVPWYPDFQCRLVRNDGTMRFRGIRHSSAEPLFPRRYLPFPLYHLNLVLQDADTRRGKVVHYRDLRTDLQAPGGGSHDRVFYLPEDSATRQPVPVPEEDRKQIARVLSPSKRLKNRSVRVPPVTPLQESDRFWMLKEQTDESAYRAEIYCIERGLVLHAGEVRAIHFKVSNTGTESWPWEPHDPHLAQVQFSYHWLDADGNLVEWDGLRTTLPESLGAGQSAVVPATVGAPPEAGSYILEVDLVWHRWFDARSRYEVEVTAKSARAGLST